jgi:Zn-dependent protease with chaperone function
MRFARVLTAVCFILVLLIGSAQLLAQAAPPSQPQPAQTQTAPSQPASDQAYNLPPDKLAKAIALDKIRITLDIGGALWGIVFLWLLLSRRWAAGLQAWAARLTSRRWIQGLQFFAAFTVITTLASFPLDMIGHAVSRHFGISVQHWGGWLGDQAKGLGVSLVITTWIMLLFNWLVRVSPRAYWFWVWLVSLPLILLAVFASPLIIDPLFNHFEPLTKTHATLVTKLETVVARTGTNIPPERMFLMKASEKSNGLNAYVTGIGSSKRFVMWDTATDRLPDDEIMYVFGHESGHYVLGHIPKMLSIFAVGLFFVFWGCARMSEGLLRRKGAGWGIEGSPGVAPVATRAGFVALFLVLNVVGFLVTPATNTISRHYEHQADVYGQEAMHGLIPDPQRTAVSGFNHLGEAWLENPNPSPFVEFWLYNHPSVKNRANFAAHYDPWANGGHGEFFQK